MDGLIETVFVVGGVGSVIGIIWAISVTLKDRNKESFNREDNP